MKSPANEPILNLDGQALVAKQAVFRYVKRYAATLKLAGRSEEDVAAEVHGLFEAIGNEVLSSKKASLN